MQEDFNVKIEPFTANYNSLQEMNVTSPSHYSRLNPQTIQRMQDVLTPEEFQGFCRGNIIKYAERMRHKDDPSHEAAKIENYSKWLHQSLVGQKVTVE